MSTIEEIIKIERDTAAQLESAKKEAEKIKTAAREEAVIIIDDAKAKRKLQSEEIYNETDTQTSEFENKTMDELNEKLNRSKLSFDRQTGNVADWIVEQIIR
ncbi:hypothetical protein KAH27_08090 [bacterium]|nr:hypothetical protein [bacterium]